MPELKEVFDMVSQKLEPDLDSWNQQERRQRRSARNRKLGAFALVATLAIAAAVIVVTTRSGEETSRKAAVDPDLPTVEGSVPTTENLAGIWVSVHGSSPTSLMMQLNPDGTYAIDDSGRVATTPAVAGTYEIEGDRIALVAGERSAKCTIGDIFAMRAGVSEDGRLETVFVEPGCTVAAGTRYTWARVSPRSKAGAAISFGEPSGDAAPPADIASLRGIWLLEGTGQLLRIDWSGSYAIDGSGRLGTDPFDEGVLELRRRTLTFTSGGNSRGCGDGTRWVWKGVVVEPFALAMRGVTEEDGCDHGAAADMAWIHISS